MKREFPSKFTWGVATSSFQIEGAPDADGRVKSIWDTLCEKPGAIEDGTDGRVACDHFNRWKDDVALIASLGVNAYRFSIAWPRVLNGDRVNEKGIGFYDRLVDELLAKNITPWVTLYHWDLPQTLEDAGGWPSRALVPAFVNYADVVTRRLGDRVKNWITHNEPWCISVLGYARGEHAPGLKSWPLALKAAHHLLLSHGEAMKVIRANVPSSNAGIVLNLTPGFPASNDPADVEVNQRFDGEFNRWYLDPLYRREYPTDHVAFHRAQGNLPDGLDFVKPGDLDTIATPTDFLGVNYYSRAILRSEHAKAPRTLADPPASSKTDMGWEVYPDGLRVLLERLKNDYAPKAIVITENGAAYSHEPGADGQVHDAPRTEYFAGHLDACHRAIANGVPLTGYFAWSLMDNFEWAWGYRKRFGLVHVDYTSQKRTVKDSGYFFAKVAKGNGLP